MVEELTIDKLLKCKKELEEADAKMPRVYINGVEYIYLKGTRYIPPKKEGRKK